VIELVAVTVALVDDDAVVVTLCVLVAVDVPVAAADVVDDTDAVCDAIGVPLVVEVV